MNNINANIMNHLPYPECLLPPMFLLDYLPKFYFPLFFFLAGPLLEAAATFFLLLISSRVTPTIAF